MRRFQWRTPNGPSRWAQSRRCRSSAASARVASPATAASWTASACGEHGGTDRSGRIAAGHPLDRVAACLQRRDAPRRRRRGGAPRPAGRSPRRSGAPWSGRRPGCRCGARSRGRGRVSTAPASTELSWSGSPTSTSRASGRVASSSRAIIVSDTIEASSTTTRSCGSRLPRWWRKRVLLPGCWRSSRCSVMAVDVGQPRLVGPAEAGGRVAHGLLQPGGGLAGGSGERDAQGLAPRLRLLDERGQQARDRGGLARARSAGDDGRGLDRRAAAGPALLVGVGVGEDPLERSRSRGRGRRRAAPVRARRGRRGPGSPARGSGRGRPGRARRAPRRRPAQDWRRRRRPRPRARARAGRGPGGSRHGGEVEGDGAVAYGPDRQRDREQHRLVALPDHAADVGGDVDVGSGQHAGAR